MKTLWPLLLLLGLSHALPLPSAYYEKTPYLANAGNMRTKAALADIAAFEALLLKDPVSYTSNVTGKVTKFAYPRKIFNSDDAGVISGDGQDDAITMAKFMKTVCDTSRDYYTQITGLGVEELRLPEGFGPRPVLVEARFKKNGVYDLGQGLWFEGPCKYVLFNLQNATIVTHFEDSWVNQQHIGNWGEPLWDTRMVFAHGGNFSQAVRYLLNVNMRTATPGNTMGTVVDLIKNNDGKTVGFRLQALPGYPAVSSITDPKRTDENKAQHVDAKGQYNHKERPFAIYAGYDVVFKADKEGDLGGIMTVNYVKTDDNFFNNVSPFITLGQYYGLTTGFQLRSGDNFRVVQGLNGIGLSAGYGVALQDVDIIDCHQDRLRDMMFIQGGDPPAQMSTGGSMRFWHSSFEGGSDDLIDILAGNSDVWQTFPDTKTIYIKTMSGAWKNSSYYCPQPGNFKVGFAKLPNAMTYTATATVSTCATKDGYTQITLVDWPSNLAVGDILYQLDLNPTYLHIKNVRLGNHQFNGLNVKSQTILMEDSYIYNDAGNGLELAPDAGYWREGNVITNVVVRNNVFVNNFCDISFEPAARSVTPDTWTNDDHRFDTFVPPKVAETMLISGNYFQTNLTDVSPLIDGWSWQGSIYLRAINTLTLTNNTFILTPGMTQSRGVINFGNIGKGSISYNNVKNLPVTAGKYNLGEKCNYSGNKPVCPLFNQTQFVRLLKDQGMIFTLSSESTIDYKCNAFAASSYAQGSSDTVFSSKPYAFCPMPKTLAVLPEMEPRRKSGRPYRNKSGVLIN